MIISGAIKFEISKAQCLEGLFRILLIADLLYRFRDRTCGHVMMVAERPLHWHQRALSKYASEQRHPRN